MKLSVIILILIHITISHTARVGEPCDKASKTRGVCMKMNDCFNGQKLVRANRDICGYDRESRTNIVCCGNSHKYQKAIDKCEEYSHNRYTKDCNPAIGVIIGGKNAKIGEFPHAAALAEIVNNKTNFKCGGSLISERYILTAAHCNDVTFARLGYTNIFSESVNDRGRDYFVEKVIPHENYNSSLILHDIALLKLNERVEFTGRIRPACLYYQDYVALDSDAEAIGWGLLEYGGEMSPILQKINLNITRDPKRCKAILNEGRYDENLIEIIREQICAYGGPGRDTCQGDSGGSLHVLNEINKCIYHVLGVTSHGLHCGSNKPSVYTRVHSYIEWIQKIVWP